MTLAETGTWGEYALSALVTYGPLALGVVLFLCAAGAPLPGSVVLVAAGAFAGQGLMAWQWALPVALASVVLGDNLAFAVGRTGGAWTELRFGRSDAWQSALDQFNESASWTIFLTRWLLSPLGSVVAMIAGISRFPWPGFILIGTLGEAIWVGIYWTIGWVLGSQWQAAAAFLSDFSGLILGVSVLLAALILGARAVVVSRRERAAAGEEEGKGPESLGAGEPLPPMPGDVMASNAGASLPPIDAPV